MKITLNKGDLEIGITNYIDGLKVKRDKARAKAQNAAIDQRQNEHLANSYNDEINELKTLLTSKPENNGEEETPEEEAENKDKVGDIKI